MDGFVYELQENVLNSGWGNREERAAGYGHLAREHSRRRRQHGRGNLNWPEIQMIWKAGLLKSKRVK